MVMLFYIHLKGLYFPQENESIRNGFSSLFHLMGLYFSLEMGLPLFMLFHIHLMGLYFPRENGTICNAF